MAAVVTALGITLALAAIGLAIFGVCWLRASLHELEWADAERAHIARSGDILDAIRESGTPRGGCGP